VGCLVESREVCVEKRMAELRDGVAELRDWTLMLKGSGCAES
jgi:hypothetical protein